MDTISPTHDLVLGNPAAGPPGTVIFGPDGRLYVETSEQALNVWNALAYQWPEVLGAVLAVVLLPMLVIVLRVWRRPREAGKLYCRRCNYCLSGLPNGVPCSECGTNPRQRGPATGRARWRRLATPLTVALLACGAYAALFAAGVPREENGAKGLCRWVIPAVSEYAKDKKVKWLLRHDRPGGVLLELDPSSGKVIRRICETNMLGRLAAVPISISPDGRHAVGSQDSGELVAIDLPSGRVRRSVAQPDEGTTRGTPIGGSCWRHVAGWFDAESVCVQWFDETNRVHEAYRWNFATGEMRKLADVLIPDSPKQSRVPARKLFLVPGTNLSMALEVPDYFAEGITGPGASTVRVRDLAANGRLVNEVTRKFGVGLSPVLSADGVSFFVRVGPGFSIQQVASVDGTTIEEFRTPVYFGEGAGLAYHSASHRLFVAACDPDGIRVRDTESKKWIADLRFGMSAFAGDPISVSPDGRWVATRATGGILAMNSADHLLIFDLSKLKP